MKSWRLLPLIALLLLAACKTELYSGISEREANEMIALLDRFNIQADKSGGKDDIYTVSVEKNSFATAVDILGREGYPKRQFGSFSDIFQSSGLIPTPFEEKIRYLYGISEELSHTVSLFDGVVETRVHVALPPDGDTLDGEKRGGKASVYIKHDPLFTFSTLIPKIKRLVSDSIDGVDYDSVEILALPADTTAPAVPPTGYASLFGIGIRPGDYWHVVAAVIAAGTLLAGLAAWSAWMWRHKPSAPSAAGTKALSRG